MGLSPEPDRTSRDASADTEFIELVEVLWERGREPVATGRVSASQLRVLYTLDSEEGINLRRLAETLGSASPSVSRLCDRLQATGFVERTPSPVSRRELELRLTGHGREYLADLRLRREDVLMPTIDAMPPTARRALLEGLRGFRNAAASSMQESDGARPWRSTG